MGRVFGVGLPVGCVVAAQLAAVFCFAPLATGREVPCPPAPDPRHRVDYLNWLKRSFAPPPDSDAAPFYMRVERFFPDYGNTDEFFGPFLNGPWSNGTSGLHSRLLKYEWADREFVRATDQPGCFVPLARFGDFSDFVIMIDFNIVRWAAKVHIVRAWGNFDSGQEGRGIDAARRCLVAADHLAQQPTLFAQFQAAALTALGAKTVLQTLHHTASRKRLVEDQQYLEGQFIPPRLSALRGYVGEQVGQYDACQRCFRWDEQTGTYVVDQKGFDKYLTLAGEVHPKASVAARGRNTELEFAETRDLISGYYALLRELLSLPQAQCLKRRKELDVYALDHRAHPFTDLMLFDSVAVTRIHFSMIRALGEWHGANITWHVFDAHGRTGRFPATLEALPPDAIASIGFAAQQGLAWNYKPDANSFSLSLVGLYTTDEKQRPDTKSAVTFWPVMADHSPASDHEVPDQIEHAKPVKQSGGID